MTVPPDEYIAVDYASDDYDGDAITVESLTAAHGIDALDAFREWWDDNREGRSVAVLPTQVGGIFVEDYLDWVGSPCRAGQATPPPPAAGAGTRARSHWRRRRSRASTARRGGRDDEVAMTPATIKAMGRTKADGGDEDG